MGSTAGVTETVLYDTLVNYLISMARTVEGAMNRALEAIVGADDPKVSALVGEVFLLEPRIADRQHLVHDENLRVEVRGDRKGQPDVHAAAVALDGGLEELIHFRERDDFVEAAGDLPPRHAQDAAVEVDVVAPG